MSSHRGLGELKCAHSSHTWALKRGTVDHAPYKGMIPSPTFALRDLDFQLQLYPKGNGNSRYMGIFLKLLPGGGRNSKITFRLSILGSDGKRHAAFERIERLDKDTRAACWGTTEFILRSEYARNKMLYTPCGLLSVCCEISFGGAIREPEAIVEDHVEDVAPPRKRPRLEQLQEREHSGAKRSPFEKYFDSERRSDAKFVLFDGRCIHAHAIVLESKSDAFAGMFSEDVSVESPGFVEVKGVEYEVLYEAIRFVYTGKVENLDELAEKLLEPATRFMLDDLKSICEKSLSEKLSVGNAIGSLILAEDKNLLVLRERAKKFIAANMKDIVNLPEFETVMKEKPNIALEIVRCNDVDK